MELPEAEMPEVDVVIPAYAEALSTLETTVEACLQQTRAVSKIIVVDDHSPVPIELPEALSERVELVRLKRNEGVATARNAGIGQATAPLILCLDVEVILNDDWVETCAAYMGQYPHVGACCGQVEPVNPASRGSRWRMKFLEPPYEVKAESGRIAYAKGAVLFRSEPLADIGGYDERFTYAREDSEISERLQGKGWEVHVVVEAQAVSLQDDSNAALLAKKLLRNNYWAYNQNSLDGPYSRRITLPKFALEETRGLANRLARNTLTGRFGLLPVDVAVWKESMALGMKADYASDPQHASGQTLAHPRSRVADTARQSPFFESEKQANRRAE